MFAGVDAFGEIFVQRAGFYLFGQLHHELNVDVRREQGSLEIADEFIDGGTVDDRLAGEFLHRVFE